MCPSRAGAWPTVPLGCSLWVGAGEDDFGRETGKEEGTPVLERPSLGVPTLRDERGRGRAVCSVISDSVILASPAPCT